MAAIADLIGKLKLLAKITDEERLSPSSVSLDDFLTDLIQQAVAQHNPSLTVATLPAAEERLVLLLAQIEICYVRAEKWVNDPAVKAGGTTFTIAPDSPFNKNIKMAEELLSRYNTLVAQLGVTSGAATVVATSTVYKRSDRLDVIFPLFDAPQAPPALLVASLDPTAPDENIVLDWSGTPKVDFFYRYWVFWSLTPGIYQAWNSIGVMTVPRIKSSAAVLFDTYNQDQQQILGEGFDPDTDYYFIVVTQTQGNKFTYSNEVLIRTDA